MEGESSDLWPRGSYDWMFIAVVKSIHLNWKHMWQIWYMYPVTNKYQTSNLAQGLSDKDQNARHRPLSC